MYLQVDPLVEPHLLDMDSHQAHQLREGLLHQDLVPTLEPLLKQEVLEVTHSQVSNFRMLKLTERLPLTFITGKTS